MKRRCLELRLLPLACGLSQGLWPPRAKRAGLGGLPGPAGVPLWHTSTQSGHVGTDLAPAVERCGSTGPSGRDAPVRSLGDSPRAPGHRSSPRPRGVASEPRAHQSYPPQPCRSPRLLRGKKRVAVCLPSRRLAPLGQSESLSARGSSRETRGRIVTHTQIDTHNQALLAQMYTCHKCTIHRRGGGGGGHAARAGPR